MAFTKGDQVVQVVVPITGRVAGFSVDQETGKVQVKVEWLGADGVEHSRYFQAHEIELAAQPAVPGA